MGLGRAGRRRAHPRPSYEVIPQVGGQGGLRPPPVPPPVVRARRGGRAAAAALAGLRPAGASEIAYHQRRQGRRRDAVRLLAAATVRARAVSPLATPCAGRSSRSRRRAARQNRARRSTSPTGRSTSREAASAVSEHRPRGDPRRLDHRGRSPTSTPAPRGLTVPLFNSAGILQVSPGTTYGGFVAPPGRHRTRTRPAATSRSGRRTFTPLLPTTDAQAVALARAARGSVAVEAEERPRGGRPGRHAVAARGRRDRRPPRDADTVIYAGEDAVNAGGRRRVGAAREPSARACCFPDALADPAGSSAAAASPRSRLPGPPRPGPRRGVHRAALERAFDERARSVRPLLGYRAMKGILGAARARQATTPGPPPGP